MRGARGWGEGAEETSFGVGCWWFWWHWGGDGGLAAVVGGLIKGGVVDEWVVVEKVVEEVVEEVMEKGWCDHTVEAPWVY